MRTQNSLLKLEQRIFPELYPHYMAPKTPLLVNEGIITLLLFCFSRLIVISNYTKLKQTIYFSIIIEPNITDLNKLFIKNSYVEVEFTLDNYFKNLLIFLLEVEFAVKPMFTDYAITRVLNDQNEKIPLLDDSKVRVNFLKKLNSIGHLITNTRLGVENSGIISDYKKKKLEKINFILKDKELLKILYKAFYLNKPKFKRKKVFSRIIKTIRRGKFQNLLGFVVNKLVKRRKSLWRHIHIIMCKVDFFVIGKNFRLFYKQIANTFISQTDTYCLNDQQQARLNAKFIKCVELKLDKAFRIEYRRYFNNIIYLNKMIHFLYKKFYPILVQYCKKICDKYFVIPYKGKTRPFTEIMDSYLEVNRKEKKNIESSIFNLRKFKVEKYLLSNLQKKKEIDLEPYLIIRAREKYYAKHRRTKIDPKIEHWLMKHVYADMALEDKESFTRPRVNLEKREEILEETYPYLPRYSVKLERDLKNEDFKRAKPTKYRIIRLTRPKIVLQPSFFQDSKRKNLIISKNVLKLKSNSKVGIPHRVQRIIRGCEVFYKKLLRNNGYEQFMGLIKKFKLKYLFDSEFRNKPSTIMSYFLFLIMNFKYTGITREREYAHHLKLFLQKYLVRLRLFKRYDLANAFNCVQTGYIIPTRANLAAFKRIKGKARKIMEKKPNYVFMSYMLRKSLKRLTIRIRSKAGAIRGIAPLFKYNLMGTDACSPMNLKKNYMNKGSYYLLQPNVDNKVNYKWKSYNSAVKRTLGYYIAYHTNAKLYYFAPYNLFLKKFEEELLPEED